MLINKITNLDVLFDKSKDDGFIKLPEESTARARESETMIEVTNQVDIFTRHEENLLTKNYYSITITDDSIDRKLTILAVLLLRSFFFFSFDMFVL